MLQLNCIELFSLKACYLMQLHGKKKKIKKIKCLSSLQVICKGHNYNIAKNFKSKKNPRRIKKINILLYFLYKSLFRFKGILSIQYYWGNILNVQ